MAGLCWRVSLAVMSRTGRSLLREVAVLARVAGRSRIGRYLSYGVAVLARVGGRYGPYWALLCRTAWLLWPVSVAVMSRIGRYVLSEVAVLARTGGR